MRVMKRHFESVLIAGCLVFCTLLLGGCRSLYHTRYVNADISIGMTKEVVVSKYGRPYSEEMFIDEDELMEILSYKEILAYGSMLKTSFFFRDGRLIRKTQEEIQSPEVIVKEKSAKE